MSVNRRYQVELESRATSFALMPNAVAEDFREWTVSIRDLATASDQTLRIFTRPDAPVSRVQDVLLTMGIELVDPRDQGTMRGLTASATATPAWADEREAVERRDWLADFEYDSDLPGQSLWHRRQFPIVGDPATLALTEGRLSVSIDQVGWVSGGIVFYEPPTIQLEASDAGIPIDSRLASAIAAALTEASELLASINGAEL